MIKKVLIILLLLSATTVMAQSKDMIIGHWLNATGEARIQIFKAGNKYFGKLVWLKEPLNDSGSPKLDRFNIDPELNKRSLLGLYILRDFVFNKTAWEGGNIYDPKTGKTYDCRISLKHQDTLNVRGYVGISILGRTENWSRVK